MSMAIASGRGEGRGRREETGRLGLSRSRARWAAEGTAGSGELGSQRQNWKQDERSSRWLGSLLGANEDEGPAWDGLRGAGEC